MYWFFYVSIETVLQSKYLQKKKDSSHYGSNWYSIIFRVKVDETIDLTACVEVEFDDGEVPGEIE